MAHACATTQASYSISGLPLHLVDWTNPDVMFLYNHVRSTATPEDFAMIDEVYAEIDAGNEGLQCENYTEDSAFAMEYQAKHPGAIESYKDDNDVEFIEDEHGHVVIEPCEDGEEEEESPMTLQPTSPRTSPPPLHMSPGTPSPPPTRPLSSKKPPLKRSVKIDAVVEGPMNTIRYYKATVLNGQESGDTCYIPSHLLVKGINARVGDIVNAIIFITPSARCDYRAIKCLPMDEMTTLQFRLTVFGEENIGVLIGRNGANLARLSKISSPPDSTYFPRIKVTKKYDSIVEFTYKKNSDINKNILIDNILDTNIKPDWAADTQYVIERYIE